MTEYRLVIKRNRVTAEMVRKYSKEHDISLHLAKKELEDVSTPQLQYRVYPIPGIWNDIKTEEIFR